MKRPIPGKQPPKPEVKLSDAQSIDVKYGLEPVIDPSESADDGGAPSSMQFHLVECPYCGESFKTPVDASSGSARYVEDSRSAASRLSSLSKSIMPARYSHYRPCATISD